MNIQVSQYLPSSFPTIEHLIKSYKLVQLILEDSRVMRRVPCVKFCCAKLCCFLQTPIQYLGMKFQQLNLLRSYSLGIRGLQSTLFLIMEIACLPHRYNQTLRTISSITLVVSHKTRCAINYLLVSIMLGISKLNT